MSVIIGYNTIGTGGTSTLENAPTGSEFTTPAGASIVIDKITAYHNPSATQFTTKCGIYLGSNNTLVSNSATPEVTGVSGAAWRDFTYSGTKPVLAASTAYILVAYCQSRSGTNVLSWDAGAANQGHAGAGTYPTFDSPETFTHSTNKYSIYATGHYAYSITGAITVTTSIASTMDFTRHARITGSVTVTTSVASTMDFTNHSSIVGAIVVSVAVAATMVFTSGAAHYSITGAVTVATTVSSTMDFTRHAAIVGSVLVSTTIASTMAFTRHYAIAGAISVSIGVEGFTDFTRHSIIAGSINVSVVVAAVMQYHQFGSKSTRCVWGLHEACYWAYGLNCDVIGSQ